MAGLSPRVRGNPTEGTGTPAPLRSIPACAGEPHQPGANEQGVGVYPRVCGGTGTVPPIDAETPGLSPRVRGNRAHPRAVAPQHGSIPACAGEPPRGCPRRVPTGVYPRVCGGTALDADFGGLVEGLSPRVRGNPNPKAGHSRASGSIPACAGEPDAGSFALAEMWVYPRVCGGTDISGAGMVSRPGLSPRVRGNLSVQKGAEQARGSIPSCAGEPRPAGREAVRRRVYPRVCGGTQTRKQASCSSTGLSPRVRGNHELRASMSWIDATGLSPRVRGNLMMLRPRTQWQAPQGLSPRVRGNPLQIVAACCRSDDRVYPRVCGGTSQRLVGGKYDLGLSPRVRGNPPEAVGQEARTGSIPACAGEPESVRRRPAATTWVYPRVCGGTLEWY